MRTDRTVWLIALALILLTALVYAPVRHQEFLNYDDPDYVTENPYVTAGMTGHSFTWALSTGHAENWHPLTWWSHMLDVQIFGLHAGSHKLINLVFHLANTVLLFLALYRMTGVSFPSGFVAALFAVHPMHVQSVAWVAERKDVLSTLFWMATLLAYTRYVQRPGPGAGRRYMLVVVLFGLGLMAKPMLVTLPVVLLFLDFWPLRRFGGAEAGGMARWSMLVREKVPLLIMSVVSSIVTIVVHRPSLTGVEQLPLGVRFENAAVSYIAYMANMIWPEGLAIIYPYGPIPLWEAAGAVGLLIVLSVAAIRLRRTHPYVLAGWLWYLCSLLPVIGLAQVGYQARADRYTYIPFVGLFVIAAWSIPALLLKQRAATRVALAVVALAVIVASSLATRIELGYYRDSVTLWSRAVAVTKDNWVAYDNLGIAFGKKGMFDEAERRLRIAVSLQSQNASVHADLGSALGFQGKTEEAVAHFSRSLELNPGSVRVRHNLAVALTTLGRHAAAIDVLKEALRISPTDATANFDMGQLLRARGNVKDAAVHLEAALKTQPNFPEARRALDELRRRGR